MKLNLLLTGLLGSTLLLLAAPAAHASKFTGWQFDANRNQLDFGTDTSVKPKAILVDGPYFQAPK
jgi:N-acetylmuramoyl-L-alanine amidase